MEEILKFRRGVGGILEYRNFKFGTERRIPRIVQAQGGGAVVKTDALGWSFSMRKACVAVDGHVPTRGWEKIAVFLKD